MADIILMQQFNADIRENRRARRINKLRKARDDYRNQPLRRLSENDIKEKYRLNSSSIELLLKKIGAKLKSHTKRSFALSPLLQILLCLRFLAGDSYYHIVADTLKVSKASVCRCIARVVRNICSLANKEIVMPSIKSLIEVKKQFKAIAGMPHVVGCVDGTFVKITKPKLNPHEFICRKHYPAINVQVL